MDFLDNAPRFIAIRFYSINKSVRSSLIPEELIKKKLTQKTTKKARKEEYQRLKSISDEAAIVAFIFIFRKLLIEGSNAAKNAVDTFEQLGEKGFYIGNDFFSGRNEKVIQGEKLADKLLKSIKDKKLKQLVLDSDYMSQILREYKNKI